MGSQGPTSRQELEQLWRERLKAAQANYNSAVAEYKKVRAEHAEWPLPAPDGSSAVRNALRHETFARAEYIKTLRIFTDLIVSGKGPGDDQGQG